MFDVTDDIVKPLFFLNMEDEQAKDNPMNESEQIRSFFKWYKTYDLMPTSTKLIVLDKSLIVKKAFNAMVDTGVRACILWDSKLQEFNGMLTITDFIRILQKNYKAHGETMHAFEEQKLTEVKGINPDKDDSFKEEMMEALSASVPKEMSSISESCVEPDTLSHVSAESSLYDAAVLFLARKIHRLPIVDPVNGNVLFVMTQKLILKYAWTFFPNLNQVTFLQKTIREAEVGTFGDIKVATMDMTIIDALNIFVAEKVSALPIVDNEGRLIHIYSKFDVINLAAEKTYAYLDSPLKDAINHKKPWFSGVYSCKADHSIMQVIEGLVRREVSRLVVTDDEEKVIGVVTIADILFHLIYHTTGESRKGSEINLLNYMSSESLFENLRSPSRNSEQQFTSKFVLGSVGSVSLSAADNDHKPALAGNRANRHFGDLGVIHSEPVFIQPNSFGNQMPNPESRCQTANQNGASVNSQNGGNFNSLFGDGSSVRNINESDILKDSLERRIDTAIDIASALTTDNSKKLEDNSAATTDSAVLAAKVCRSPDKSSSEQFQR